MTSNQAATSGSNFRAHYRVLIVGAGLVGLLLAIDLKRAGYQVAVVDKDTELKEIGAGIILPPNACRALQQAGVLAKVQSCAVAPQKWISHSYQNGTILGQMELDPYVRERYDMPFLVIHRSDLRRILFEEATARGVIVQFDTTVEMHRADFKNGLVYANLSDSGCGNSVHGDESAKRTAFAADLVVAADGQQSETRAFLSGRPNSPAPTGKMVNRILMDIGRMRELGLEDLIDPPSIHVWLGPGSLAVGYLLKNVFNFVLTCSSENEASVFLGPRPVDEEELLAVFKDWDPRIRLLVENGHGYLKWLLLENGHNEVGSWVHAAEGDKLIVALTGDAAHAIGPYIGSGAALGFESAMVLGQLLEHAGSKSEIPKRLKVYESLRRPRTELVGGVTRKMGAEWMMYDSPQQAKRDETFLQENPPLQGYPNALQDPFFQTWLYSFDGRKEADEAWRIYHREHEA
ncbi:MAG: hypothetical protein Q9224_002956 [Gallowayella concinna]